VRASTIADEIRKMAEGRDEEELDMHKDTNPEANLYVYVIWTLQEKEKANIDWVGKTVKR
jgi:hypothetical protein